MKTTRFALFIITLVLLATLISGCAATIKRQPGTGWHEPQIIAAAASPATDAGLADINAKLDNINARLNGFQSPPAGNGASGWKTPPAGIFGGSAPLPPSPAQNGAGLDHRLQKVEKKVAAHSALIGQHNKALIEQALNDAAEWAIEKWPEIKSRFTFVKAVRVAVFDGGKTEIDCSGECEFRSNYRAVLAKRKSEGYIPFAFIGFAHKDGDEKNEKYGQGRAEHIKLIAKDLSVYDYSVVEQASAAYAYETDMFGSIRNNRSGIVIFAK